MGSEDANATFGIGAWWYFAECLGNNKDDRETRGCQGFLQGLVGELFGCYGGDDPMDAIRKTKTAYKEY